MDAAMQLISQAKVEKKVGAGLSNGTVQNLGVATLALETSAAGAVVGAVVGSFISNTRRGTTWGAAIGGVLGGIFGTWTGYEVKQSAA